jgi:S-adenosylmethionine:tRNA ribosyltransferase-isomerase
VAVKLSDFDYQLPESLIAQEPVTPRDASRLMVVARSGGAFEDARFSELDRLLRPGDLLVFNDTRVLAARLLGSKESGGRCELLLVEPLDGEGGARWRALGQASKALREGSRLRFGTLGALVETAEGEGFVVVRFDRAGRELAAGIEREGRIPLPPYIRREPRASDRERYQTILARVPGSAAAPTAGLHFTETLLHRLARRGVARTAVTLHVGPGTFLPVRGDDVEAHRMHEERYEVPAEAARAFAECRGRGGRVVAVGTTAVRTLESAWSGGALRAGPGRTSIFIRPHYDFRAIDGLVTNLHLPRSTLLMLVCAFAGRERTLGAYREAVSRQYRFFSYGDAMLLT